MKIGGAGGYRIEPLEPRYGAGLMCVRYALYRDLYRKCLGVPRLLTGGGGLIRSIFYRYFVSILQTVNRPILWTLLLTSAFAFGQTSFVERGGAWVGSDGSSFVQRGGDVVTPKGSYTPQGSAVIAPNGQAWTNQNGTWVNGQQSIRQVGGAWVNQDNKACVLRGGAWVCDK